MSREPLQYVFRWPFRFCLEVLVFLGVLVIRNSCTGRPTLVDWSELRRIQYVAAKRTCFSQRSRAGMSNQVDDKSRDWRGGTLSPSMQVRADSFGWVNFDSPNQFFAKPNFHQITVRDALRAGDVLI